MNGLNNKLSNVLTIDFEDWYQGLEIPIDKWGNFEDRIEYSGNLLINILAKYRVRATFFVLGYVAEHHPKLIKKIITAGHRVGTHGYSHTLVYRQKPGDFKKELNKSIKILYKLTKQPIISHRAPFFSITQNSLWALKILAQAGIKYDSSIFPISNYRYGIKNSPTFPYKIKTENNLLEISQSVIASPSGKLGTGSAKQSLRDRHVDQRSPRDDNSSTKVLLYEFPLSTFKVGQYSQPIAGGAYFRFYPYQLTYSLITSLNRSGIPIIFYLHPWELDPDHPRIQLPPRISIPHYLNLKNTQAKFERLLTDFKFEPLEESTIWQTIE